MQGGGAEEHVLSCFVVGSLISGGDSWKQGGGAGGASSHGGAVSVICIDCQC